MNDLLTFFVIVFIPIKLSSAFFKIWFSIVFSIAFCPPFFTNTKNNPSNSPPGPRLRSTRDYGQVPTRGSPKQGLRTSGPEAIVHRALKQANFTLLHNLDKTSWVRTQ